MRLPVGGRYVRPPRVLKCAERTPSPSNGKLKKRPGVEPVGFRNRGKVAFEV